MVCLFSIHNTDDACCSGYCTGHDMCLPNIWFVECQNYGGSSYELQVRKTLYYFIAAYYGVFLIVFFFALHFMKKREADLPPESRVLTAKLALGWFAATLVFGACGFIAMYFYVKMTVNQNHKYVSAATTVWGNNSNQVKPDDPASTSKPPQDFDAASV